MVVVQMFVFQIPTVLFKSALPERDKFWADGDGLIIQFGRPGLGPNKVVVDFVFTRGTFLSRHKLKRVEHPSVMKLVCQALKGTIIISRQIVHYSNGGQNERPFGYPTYFHHKKQPTCPLFRSPLYLS